MSLIERTCLGGAGGDKGKEGEGPSGLGDQSSGQETSLIKTGDLMRDRDTAIKTLARSRFNEEQISAKIRERFPGATDEEVDSMFGEVMAKRKELY